MMLEFLLLHEDGEKRVFDLAASCLFFCLVPQATPSFTQLSSVHLLGACSHGLEHGLQIGMNV